MKLNFKDLKQQKFTIDAEPEETVADVKQKVAADKGFDAAQMRLIWSGKILADANTIGSYEIKPTDQIVCMVQKPKAAPAAPKAPTTPAPAPAQTPSPPAPAPAPAVTAAAPPENAPATPSPAPATTATTQAPESTRSLQDPSPMMLGAERQAAIANMEGMGFERPQIERAMRAAFFNPDRAVEYLLNGIPETAVADQPPPRAPPAAQPTAAPTPPAPSTATATEADEPVNLFEAAAAAQGNRGASRGAGAGAAAGTGAGAGPGAGLGAAAAGAGAGAGAAGAAGNLDFLRDNPTFRQIRQLVHQQPSMLENVLQTVGASNPQLAELISQNPDQFLQLLAEGGEEGEGGAPMPPGIQNVSVTPEERDAIERLCRLGFERDLVIQAYFACDKNEELAANFLFDNPDDDVDQQ